MLTLLINPELGFELISLMTLTHLCSLDGLSILSYWRDRDLRKAAHLCPQRWELLGAVRAGGPLRTMVQPNQTVVLQCRFCEDPEDTEDDDDIGMWTYFDIVGGSAPVRVPSPNLGDINETPGSFLGFWPKPRIVLTEGQGLALKKPRTTDLGIYQCRRDKIKSSLGSTVSFLIDMDIALFEEQLKQEKEKTVSENYEEDDGSEEDESIKYESTVTDVESNFMMETPHINGSSDDWPTYRKSHLDPLDKIIARANLHLEAISNWSPWTDCSQCWTTKYGVRTRRGVCILRLPLQERDNDDDIVKELAGLPALTCRSAILHRLHPQVGDEARKVPDFIEHDYRGCNGVCAQNTSKSRGSLSHRLVYLFRHRRDAPLITHTKMTIVAGESLVIVCPGATSETPVHWQKDGESIGGGSSKSAVNHRSAAEQIITDIRKAEHWVSGQVVGIKDQPGNSAIVDSAGVLRVPIAAPKNSGNYECSVNGTPRGSFQVEVVVQSSLSFDDLLRHFAYITLVLLSGVMVWCGIILCMTIRRRLQKHNYTELPQTDGRNRSGRSSPVSHLDNDSPGSPHDMSRGRKNREETALHPNEKASKRARKQRTQMHLDSVKLLSAMSGDSQRPPSPPTVHYRKVSRLWDCRARPFSRLLSRRSSANDDMELVRLMVPRSSVHSTHYRPRTPSGRHCLHCSSASSFSGDVSTNKGPVTILSQQLFPSSQKVLRPTPLPAVKACTSIKEDRKTTEAASFREQADRVAGPVGLSPLWFPSAISISVLRARNSLRKGVASGSSNTSKLNRTVQEDQPSTINQCPKTAGAPVQTNVRSGRLKKVRKCKNPRSKGKLSSKPRRPHAPVSEKRRKKTSNKLKKRSSFASSPAHPSKSLVRKNLTSKEQPKIGLHQRSSSKSYLSKLANLHVDLSGKSPVHFEPIPSSMITLPRLSLLYKALPSTKPDKSLRFSQGSCMSFTSNSMNNSTVDQVSVPSEEDKVLDSKRLSADSEMLSNAPPAKPQEHDTNSVKKLSLKSATINSDQAIARRSLKSPGVESFRQHSASNPPTESQYSMFQIPEIVDNKSQHQIPSFPVTDRQSPTLHRVAQTQPAEHSDSLENLELVAAFLDTSAQKTAWAPRRPLLQSHTGCIPIGRSQNCLPTSHHAALQQPSPEVVASPYLSETIFPRTPCPTTRPRPSNVTTSSMTDSLYTGVPSNLVEQVPHKTSPIQKTFTPIPSQPPELFSSSSHNRFSTMQVSRQLLPALLFPCAIVVPDQVPKFSKSTTSTPATPVTEPSPMLKQMMPTSHASPVRTNISSIKSSTSTLQSFLTPSSEHVLTESKKNIFSTSRADSGLCIEGLGEEERISLCSSSHMRKMNSVKEVRHRPSRGRNVSPKKSQSKKLLPVSALISSGCLDGTSEVLSTIRETKSEDVRSSSSGRFRAQRSETETPATPSSEWIPAQHKITTKPPFSSKSAPYSAKTSAAATFRKIASTRFSKHKGFYIRQKPGLEQFQIVLVDTDELAKKDEMSVPETGLSSETETGLEPQTEQENESETPLKRKTSMAGSKDKSKLQSVVLDSLTQFATPVAAIAIPQIMSSSSLFAIFQQKTAQSEAHQSTHREPQRVGSEFRPVLSEATRRERQTVQGESQSIQAEAQLIQSASRIESQPTNNKHQPTRSKPLQVRNESQKAEVKSQTKLDETPTSVDPLLIRSQPQSTRSEYKYRGHMRRAPQHISDATSQLTTVEIHSGPSHTNIRPRQQEATSSVNLPPSRSQEQFSHIKKDLVPKPANGTRSTQRGMNRSKKSSLVSLPAANDPFEFKFQQGPKYDAFRLNGIPRDTVGFPPTKSSQPSISSSIQKIGSNSGSQPCYQYVKLSQSVPGLCGSPSLVKLLYASPNSSKSYGVNKTSLLHIPVLLKPESLPSLPKTGPSQLSAHEESRFAAELLPTEPTSASSHMTQVENTDIVDARKTLMRSDHSSLRVHLDPYGPTHGKHKPVRSTMRQSRNLVDEATSYGSLGERFIKPRRVRLATNEVALQVSNTDIQYRGPLRRTQSIPKRQQFTTKKRPVPVKVRSNTNIKPQKSCHERSGIKGRTAKTPHDQRPVLLSPSCRPNLETQTVTYPHDFPEDVDVSRPSCLPTPIRKKSTHPVRTYDPRPKTPLHQTSRQNRTKTHRKPNESSTPSRPHSSIANSNSTPLSPTKSQTVKSPPRKRQVSPTSNARASKGPQESEPPGLGPCAVTQYTASACANFPEPNELPPQDYNSHHLMNPQEIEIAELKSHSTEISFIDVVNEVGNENAAIDRDRTTPLGTFNDLLLQNMPLENESIFGGAVVNSAQRMIAISVPQYDAAHVSEPAVSAPALGKSSASAKIQSDTKVTSSHLARRENRSGSQPALTRRRKSRKQIRRAVPSVDHLLDSKSSLSVGTQNKKSASEVFVFGAQEPSHSGQNLLQLQRDSSLAPPRILSNFTSEKSDVPENSTVPIFLQDGFTAVLGISTADLTRRTSSRHNLDSK